MKKMPRKAIWSHFSRTLFTTPSTPRYFNPYYPQDNSEIDLPHAHQIRRDNLRNYLGSFEEKPSVLIIGEAPGWRGCRFSGVPFTSEAQLSRRQLPFSGQRSSRGAAPLAESSATIFWRLLKPYHPRFFVWNCIPFHPHQPDLPFSNRTPTGSEISRHAPLLLHLLALLSPERIVALGRSAQHSLEQIEVPATYVRHPSHGGAKAFQAGMERLLDTEQSTQSGWPGG